MTGMERASPPRQTTMIRNKVAHRLVFGTIRTVAKMAALIPFVDWFLGRLGWLSILLYRRFVSPYKGFRCAHAAVTSGPSCSDVGFAEFSSQPMSLAVSALDAQFHRCKQSHTMAMNGDFSDLLNMGTELPPMLANDIVCCDLS